MHFSVFHSVQKQKYLEKIDTNIAVRPLCTETILFAVKSTYSPSFKGFTFVDFC